MRFMIIRKADPETEASVMPSQELMAAMGAYMEELGKAGILRGGDGLRASAKGARIQFKSGKPTVTDGPFAETKELVAGFLLIEVNSLQDAIGWMKKWPALDGHGNASLEIRPLVEAEDFGEAFTPELQEKENALRAKTEGKKH